MVVGGRGFVVLLKAVLIADVDGLLRACFLGRRLLLVFEMLPAFDVGGEFFFFAGELLLPFFFVALHFLHGLEVLETAGVGARRFGFVAVEAVEMIHFGDRPRDGVGFTFAEMVLKRVSDALTAEQNPVVLDGAVTKAVWSSN